ncbi:MAG: hypothetical protein CMJ29_12600 [Phycisphaerae bacterium]|nr:hypothetical protein [Phycisphaerae bacterium]MAT82469.1 hypothetical protein [Phycisphaerae bacterium]
MSRALILFCHREMCLEGPARVRLNESDIAFKQVFAGDGNPEPSKPSYTHDMNPLEAKRCTVMGLGRFGGGLGVTRWLLEQGCEVCVTDMATEASLTEALASLRPDIDRKRVRLALGGHDVNDFTDTDLVIANPAVPMPWDNPYLQSAAAHGIPISTEIRLLVERLDRTRVIGVTGTNGKSTTASMIHHVLTRTGSRSILGGNIGGSLLPSIADVEPTTWIVLELSSAMLYWLGEVHGESGWSPGTAVITNIAPNHLDWHGSESHYRQCKDNITRWQLDQDLVIRGDHISKRATPIPIRIPGSHNQTNALLAVMTVARATGLSPGRAAEALSDFAGLPHRLEAVGDEGRFFNDSKSTTPEATVLAVEAFAPRTSRVHLIAGGYDKGVSLEAIARLGSRLGGLYTIGTTGPGLAAEATGHAVSCGDLATAVEQAVHRMKPDDLLLLSPGCASWDQYDHFEARGEAFRSLVLTQSGSMGSDSTAPTRSLSEPTP